MKPVERDFKRVFSVIFDVEIPGTIKVSTKTMRSQAFTITFKSDGIIPFPQVIIRADYREHIFNLDKIKHNDNVYSVTIPENELPPGTHELQIEGCKKENWTEASGDDWVKWFGTITVAQEKKTEFQPVPQKKAIHRSPVNTGVKIYFGIHKHMHQPYYRAADVSYWDGEKEQIFGSRSGNYSHFIPDAVKQYIQGGLEHAGLSTSWSGSLIEQLIRCENENLCNGVFNHWSRALREILPQKTTLDNPRVQFTAFGHFHPLMSLIPRRDIVKQILLHRKTIKNVFGQDTSSILFPPETAFHVRMIPALLECGIKVVIYDSIHRYRTCKNYPYGGVNEGMLPPNQADQCNPPVNDWVQLQNVWAGSKISPSLLKPEVICYEDIDGKKYTIIGVPAERYIGNEDARGGFGALQYEHVLGQVYDSIVMNNSFDPKHPPFFVLHSDGDNHGGGADSYYHNNTGELVAWIRSDPRFELTTIDDYLVMFPPDQSRTVHIEPGAWAGADNGDPQFRKWFSMYDQPYSPDLNSWSVLTALQNYVHSAEDSGITGESFDKAQRLLLTAETSCYWYWTGQELWDRQVTEAANAAIGTLDIASKGVIRNDKTPPTIFAPWVTPENPGGKTWGQGCLRDADKTGHVHTFVFDISGIDSVILHIKSSQGKTNLPMTSHGSYPSKTNPKLTATYYTAVLPQGAGLVTYYIEAKDKKGNTGFSTLERIFLS